MVAVLLFLATGVLCAAVGANLLVRGAVGVAARMRLSPVFLGATFAAFGTSGPELAVALRATGVGVPTVAMGDVLGTNAVNLGVVLGGAVLFGALGIDRTAIRRDLPVAATSPVVVLLLAVDGTLSRPDGWLLLLLFAAWMAQLALAARASRRGSSVLPTAAEQARPLLVLLVGLVLLAAAGSFIVAAATNAMQMLGWGGYTVGVVIVATATSAPEIATVVLARLRGQDGFGLATLLGSNIFNTLGIVGFAATLRPIDLAPADIWVVVVAAVLLSLLATPGRDWRLPRGRGGLLLSVYVSSVLMTLLLQH